MRRQARRRQRGIVYISSPFTGIARGEDFEGWQPNRYPRPEKPTRLQAVSARLIELLHLPSIETLEASAFGDVYRSGRPWHIVEYITAALELEGWHAVYGKQKTYRRAQKLSPDTNSDYLIVSALRLNPNSFARRKVLGHIAANLPEEHESYGILAGQSNGVLYTATESNQLPTTPAEVTTNTPFQTIPVREGATLPSPRSEYPHT